VAKSFLPSRSRTITVVGAGFSGLVTAYYLVKAGLRVRVLEKSVRAGGLIRTIKTEHGLVETAANGIRNSARLESLCADIGVKLQASRREAKRRFIYRGRPRKWPLNIGETLSVLTRMTTQTGKFGPREFETITAWGGRVVGRGATEYFLAPALGGIYAGDPKALSASLIFRRANLSNDLRIARGPRARVRGTVAPAQGMQQLIDGLLTHLERAGVEFCFNHDESVDSPERVIVCTSAHAAADYLDELAPEVSACLRQIEMLPLVTATCFYSYSATSLRGFGCLFPRDEGFRARGVLFNDSIFEGRGPAHSETWIFGGALDRHVVQLSEKSLSELIAEERSRLYKRVDEPLAIHLTYWPNALPNYSIELERVLTNFPRLPGGVELVGNYLGGIGLSSIIDRALDVAERVAKVGTE
jgi:oxygen-dependent protoporphyrinogen oxidase